MSIYLRGNTWYMQYTAADGRRVQQSCATSSEKKAQELHDQRVAETWRVAKLGEKPRHSWEEAAVLWLREQAHKKSIEDDKEHLRWLYPFLEGRYLDEINREMVEKIRAAKLKTGVTESRVNRVMATLRAILRRAWLHWEWIDKAPFVRMAPQPPKRVRWLTHEEAARLLDALPEHLRYMTEFALLTGLRESNVTDLEWKQVDIPNGVAWIYPDKMKTGRGLGVPLSDQAISILTELRGAHPSHVFTYEGKPVQRVNNTGWRKTLKRVGITNFRFHDVRHTWASWHVQSGTPLHVLQELGGWANIKMVQIYAHLSPKHLSDYANAVSILRHPKSETPV